MKLLCQVKKGGKNQRYNSGTEEKQSGEMLVAWSQCWG